MTAVASMLGLLWLVGSAAGPAGGAGSSASVAVFPLTALVGVADPAAQLLSETLVQEVRNARAFSQVMSPREIATIMPADQQKFLMRCAAESCTVVDNELAGALGVSHIIAGTVGRLGDMYVLNLKLLEVRTSLTVGSAQQVAQGRDEGVLLKVMPQAVLGVLQDARMAPGAAAPPAGGGSGGTGPGRGAILRGLGVAGLLAAAVPAVLGLALLGGAATWAVVAFVSVAARTAVPAPPADRTVRYLVQQWGPTGMLGALGVLGVVVALGCAAAGGGLLVASLVGGG